MAKTRKTRRRRTRRRTRQGGGQQQRSFDSRSRWFFVRAGCGVEWPTDHSTNTVTSLGCGVVEQDERLRFTAINNQNRYNRI